MLQKASLGVGFSQASPLLFVLLSAPAMPAEPNVLVVAEHWLYSPIFTTIIFVIINLVVVVRLLAGHIIRVFVACVSCCDLCALCVISAFGITRVLGMLVVLAYGGICASSAIACSAVRGL
jgi:hypothetical protein